MLYGSVARGDDSPTSDIDVLVLANPNAKPYQRGRLSVTPYAPSHLEALGRAGSLFVLHLRREGIVLADTRGVLQRVLEGYLQPSTYERTRYMLRATAAILDIDEAQLAGNPQGFVRLALFLLRTELYAREAEGGTPSFAMGPILEGHADAALREVFQPKERRRTDFAYFSVLQSLVSKYLACPIHNPYGSLEAYAVGIHDASPAASFFALRILGGDRQMDYPRIPAGEHAI